MTAECADYIQMLPRFAGFDADDECIEIWVPNDLEDKVRVDVLPTRDGFHGVIMVAGRPTALLLGAPSANLRNIQLVPKSSKAA
ncbi:MAG: hypothetical protein ACR2OY_05840 [Boseongicola sp.]